MVFVLSTLFVPLGVTPAHIKCLRNCMTWGRDKGHKMMRMDEQFAAVGKCDDVQKDCPPSKENEKDFIWTVDPPMNFTLQGFNRFIYIEKEELTRLGSLEFVTLKLYFRGEEAVYDATTERGDFVAVPTNQTIEEEVLGGAPDSLPDLIAEGKSEEAAIHALVLTDAVKNSSDTEEKHHVTQHILHELEEIASKVPLYRITEAIEKALEIEEIREPDSAGSMASSLRLAAEKILRSKLDDELEQTTYADDIISTASKLTNFSALIPSPPPLEHPEHSDYPMYDSLDPENVEFSIGMRKFSHNLLKTVQVLGKLTEHRRDTVGVLTSEHIVSSTQSLPFRASLNLSLEETNASCIFPKDVVMKMSTVKGVNVQFAFFDSNPLFWDQSGGDINTQVIVIEAWSNDEVIHKLPGDVEIFLPQNPRNFDVISGQLPEGQAYKIFQVQVKNDSVLMAYGSVVDGGYFLLLSTEYPSMDKIRDNGERIDSPIKRAASILQVAIGDIAYVSVARKVGQSVHYSVEVFSVSCLTWNGSWKPEGCRTGPKTTEKITHCLCNHLSVFGGAFYVPPNKIAINLDIPVLVLLSKSILVISVVGFVLLVIFFMFVWADFQDRKNVSCGVHILADVIPGDIFPYLVCVMTSWQAKAGTTAKVALQISGVDSSSRRHLLNRPGALARGAEDWFVIFTPKYLGELTSIRLFHNSEGTGPHWNCDRVIIQDLTAGREFFFLVDQWLSLLYNQTTDITVTVADKTKALSAGVLFASHVKTRVREANLWFRIFTKPAGGTVSTKECVAVAGTALFLTLVSSALFFGVDGKQLDSGSYKISASQIGLMVEAAGTSMVFGIFVVMIAMCFMKSRPKFSGKEMLTTEIK